MIKAIQAARASKESHLCEEMFRLRAEVFHKKLNWDVTVLNGMEKDEFDECNPLYLINVDDHTGEVLGSCRLLPTSGPNMLRGPFARLLPDELVIESGLIWECTRFCVRNNCPATTSAELLLGICEIGLTAGIEQIVGVFEMSVAKIYRRIGWEPEIVNSEIFSGSSIGLGLWDVDEESHARIVQKNNIQGFKLSINNDQPTVELIA